jgi:hypothetical protein
MITSLQGLEKVTKFLKLTFLSGFIDGEKPLSVMIVAPVSSGKTTAVKQFKNTKSIRVTTDSTAYGILKNHEKQLENGEIRHIVIPDLLNALARKKVTQDQLILFINASSEDGIFPSKTYGTDISKFIEPFGWVLCITKEGFQKKLKFLDSIGFISRFFIINYSYSLEQIQNILEKIITEEKFQIPDIHLKTFKRKKKIKGNPAVFRELTVYSKLLAKNGEAEVLRLQKRLQVLAKASALSRDDDKVTKEDLENIKELMDLIR